MAFCSLYGDEDLDALMECRMHVDFAHESTLDPVQERQLFVGEIFI
jgi:hypothetical protein